MKLRYSQHRLMKKPPLIENPRGQSGFQRHAYPLLTVLFWFFFLLLFRVALTPLAWWIGAEAVYEMFAVKVNSQDFVQLLPLYALIVLLIGLLLLGWARYNQLRFRGRERRNRFLPPVTVREQAASFGLPVERVQDLQTHRRLCLQQQDKQVQICAASRPATKRIAEPVPLAREVYTYARLEIRRDPDLRWSVYRQQQRLFQGTDFASCREFLRSVKETQLP